MAVEDGRDPALRHRKDVPVFSVHCFVIERGHVKSYKLQFRNHQTSITDENVVT